MRLRNFKLTALSGASTDTPFTYDEPGTTQALYTVVPSPRISFPVSQVRFDLVAPKAMLTLCEVLVYGEISCLAGRFGLGCDRQCNCVNGGSCFVHSGGCPSGCAANYAGEDCHDCQTGKHGATCSLNCPTNCGGDNSCDRNTGACSQGCDPGYTGVQCQSTRFYNDTRVGPFTNQYVPLESTVLGVNRPATPTVLGQTMPVTILMGSVLWAVRTVIGVTSVICHVKSASTELGVYRPVVSTVLEQVTSVTTSLGIVTLAVIQDTSGENVYQSVMLGGTELVVLVNVTLAVPDQTMLVIMSMESVIVVLLESMGLMTVHNPAVPTVSEKTMPVIVTLETVMAAVFLGIGGTSV
ncbi:multiple epidermal growth factor-like domains 10 [Elysia marginata]|uniref:Multiple epidermal growth factor-like domains 10 n=1 Tax=Elysia marginata TaxID=1093978 RepID=A0AAV4IX57_9GAST|nr:multiple epidermal growth factor-like domains 10 [Elysia marginata]